MELLRSQLLRDMQHWPLNSISEETLDQAHHFPHHDPGVRTAVLIINGTVFLPNGTGSDGKPLRFPGGRHPLLIAVIKDLQELAASFPLPPIEMVVNADDYPVMGKRR